MPYKLINGKRVEIDPLTGQPIGQETAPQTQPQGMDMSSPDLFKAPETPVNQSDQNVMTFQKNRNVFDKVGDFILPRATKLVRKLAGTVNLKGDLDQADELYKGYKEESDKYFNMAKNEQDPEKKKKFMDLAKQALDQGTNLYSEAQNEYETSTGQKFEDKQLNPFVEGFGAAGEIGSFFVPAEKLAKGASLVQKILAGAKTGAKVGAIMGATAPEDLSLEDRAKRTLTEGGKGFAIGGLVSSAFEVPRAAVKKVLAGSGERMARIFSIPPSERADFRRATGDMDFAEEILSRDGKAIAGKNYEQMLEHFTNRKQEAVQALDDVITKSDKTISKKALLDSIDGELSNLKPEKGFLDIGGLKGSFEALREKVNALPQEEIPIAAANSIKKQLQEEGSKAFTASGNKANSASSAYDNVGRKVKNLIEDAFKTGDDSLIHDPKYVQDTLSKLDDKTLADINAARNFVESETAVTNPIRELNKSIQLYEQARRSIEKAGDKAVNKISNDIGQKFFQVIPTIASGGAAAGGFALGGPMGGFGGFALSQALLGGLGAARVKYLTPEVQSTLAKTFDGILKSQGVKDASNVASKIADQMIKLAVRKATSGEVNEQTDQSGQTGQENTQDINQTQGNEQVHTPSIPQEINQDETVTIRNSETGETKTVKRAELSQYGLGADGKPVQEEQGGMPSADDVLAAMALDLEQTGGKNLSKLSTFLTAIEKVEKAKGGNLSANEKAAVQEAQNGLNLVNTLEESFSELQGMGLAAKSGGFGRFLSGAKGSYAAFTQEGTEGAAAASYNNGKDAFLSKLARATGEKGVLNNQDIERIKKAIPKFSDSPETAARQFAFIKDIIQGAIDSKMKNPIGDAPSSVPSFEGGTPAF